MSLTYCLSVKKCFFFIIWKRIVCLFPVKKKPPTQQETYKADCCYFDTKGPIFHLLWNTLSQIMLDLIASLPSKLWVALKKKIASSTKTDGEENVERQQGRFSWLNSKRLIEMSGRADLRTATTFMKEMYLIYGRKTKNKNSSVFKEIHIKWLQLGS